jgi:protoheme IX farnesyltransferase
VGDYIALLKPSVMSLVLFTGVVGLVIAPGHIHVLTAFTALLCIAVGSGASGALNMAYDADIDAKMARTAARPIPCGRITVGDAYAFGLVLAVTSIMVMGLFVNYAAAGLLAFTIGFYVFIYTMWLKRRTPQNIVIGGFAGALPPAIGWAAVTGGLSLEPLILLTIVFLWTPPHFWALSLFRAQDYARAGVPMLPVVAGKPATRRQILLYSVLLTASTFLPVVFGFGGLLYLATATALSAWLLVLAVRVLRERDTTREPNARRLFGVSIGYLFILFSALIVERVAGIAPLVLPV